MVIKNVSLETVIGVTSSIPDNKMPEIAFAGKSNVGKSSLINALMNRKSLARTSAQPGKTQTINFYNINDELYFVDLPGYGYAKVSQQEKEKWGKMIEKYLRQSKVLKAVFLLIDIRHEPSANDKQMYEWILSNGYSPIIIATKLDKINRSQIQKQVKLIKQKLEVEKGTVVIPFSAESKQGRDEIWELIDSLVLVDDLAEESASGNTSIVSDSSDGQASDAAEPVKQRKPRWKAEGKETAKKTKKLQEKKAAKAASRTGKKSKKNIMEKYYLYLIS